MNGKTVRIGSILDDISNQKHEIIQTARLFVDISPEEFKMLFLATANKELAKKNIKKEFLINESNKELINQLYYYMVGSDKFIGDLYKGILVVGTLGTGKTLIMKSFCLVWNKLFKRQISMYTSRDVAFHVIEDKPKTRDNYNYIKGLIYIDDIGKEPLKVMEYGTEICPLNVLLSLRYDNNNITFGTTNYKSDTMSQIYGDTIVDRMREMFNFIKLNGKSLRQ